jgi:hypothetical protein
MDLHAADCDGLDLARRAITMPDEAVASVQKLQILYGGEERFSPHLHSLREQLPSARPEGCSATDHRIRLAVGDEQLYSRSRRTFSSGDSGRLVTSPIRRPHSVITQFHA